MRGTKLGMAHTWVYCLHHPYCLGGSPTLQCGGQKSEVAHKCAVWLHHPCNLGPLQHCEAGDKIKSGPQVSRLATSPVQSRASPTWQSGVQNQKWPTSGQIGYITPAVQGVSNASVRGTKSEVAERWACWLHSPYRLGGGHEATDTWLPNAPVSQATGHCHAKFNQFLVLCINHDWNVPLCTCSQVCSAYETPIL